MTAATAAIVVGSRVRIERDEVLYPAKGTWSRFRGRSGIVVEINADKRPHLTEYGVVFGKVRRRSNGSLHGDLTTWFRAHEMAALAPERSVQRR